MLQDLAPLLVLLNWAEMRFPVSHSAVRVYNVQRDCGWICRVSCALGKAENCAYASEELWHLCAKA